MVATREELVQVESKNVADLLALGVVQVASRTPRPDDELRNHQDGVVLLYSEGISGQSDVTWAEFHEDLDALLGSKLVERKAGKLRASGGDERHLFLGISFTSSWSVYHALSADVIDTPPGFPTVPEDVTHLWLMGAGIAERCLVWFGSALWCGHLGPTWLDAARHWAAN